MRALEIGPGKHPVDRTWTIMDMVPRNWVDVVHDIRNLPLPFEDNSFELVYLSHILEHVPWFQVVDCLIEIRRILKPGGSVEIWVPDLEYLVQCYLDKRLGDSWLKFNKERDFVTWLNGRLFTYGPGEENWHRAAFDRPYLERLLKRAGYSSTGKLLKPRGYDHGAINLGVYAVK